MSHLVYRVDGGPALGLGHVARASAITEVARNRSWEVTWATTGGPEVEAAAKEAGAQVKKPAARETETALLGRVGRRADAIVIDRKLDYSAEDIRTLRTPRPVILLDVPCAGMFEATATIFPTAHLDPAIEKDPRWGKDGRLKHGAEWVVIHPRVAGTPRAAKPDQPPRIAVTTGGSDPEDVASHALDWLSRVEADFHIDVMVGSANERREALRAQANALRHPARVLEDPREFPACLAGATLVLATFGITAYELAYLGVPAMLVSHSEENVPAAARFANWGSAVHLGRVHEVEPSRAVDEITRLLFDPGRRRGMSAAGRKLVDGKGAERIVEFVESVRGERKA